MGWCETKTHLPQQEHTHNSLHNPPTFLQLPATSWGQQAAEEGHMTSSLIRIRAFTLALLGSCRHFYLAEFVKSTIDFFYQAHICDLTKKKKIKEKKLKKECNYEEVCN